MLTSPLPLLFFFLSFNIVFVSSKRSCLPIHFRFSDSNTHMMLHIPFSHSAFHCILPPLKNFGMPFGFHGPTAAKLSICSTSPLNGKDESPSSFLSLKLWQVKKAFKKLSIRLLDEIQTRLTLNKGHKPYVPLGRNYLHLNWTKELQLNMQLHILLGTFNP